MWHLATFGDGGVFVTRWYILFPPLFFSFLDPFLSLSRNTFFNLILDLQYRLSLCRMCKCLVFLRVYDWFCVIILTGIGYWKSSFSTLIVSYNTSATVFDEPRWSRTDLTSRSAEFVLLLGKSCIHLIIWKTHFCTLKIEVFRLIHALPGSTIP